MCVCGVRKCCNFVLLHIPDQLSLKYLLKRLSFLHCIFLPPLSRTKCSMVCGFISGFSVLFSWFIVLFFFFLSVTYCNEDCNFVV